MKFFPSLYLSGRFFALLAVNVLLFILGFFFIFILVLAKAFFIGLGILLLLDTLLVYGKRNAVSSERVMAEKLSNGDNNRIMIRLNNRYPYPMHFMVIDEVPVQFQKRDLSYSFKLGAGKEKILQYFLRPVRRGEYTFGNINVYASTPILFIRKRMRFGKDQKVPVYPSYIQMRKYELMAISNRLSEYGVKKIRRIGHTMEFDQIRDYVRGDDVRNINWKATARKADLMVNQYQDEKSQHVYSLIDKGRVMKMPFEEMTLLDYAINASLVISNIAQLKHDKPGIISFAEEISTYVPAERRGHQMQQIMEVLYNQQTNFHESNYEMLYTFVRRKISNRSLLLFFTNFESAVSMKRQLPYLLMMAKHHLLVVIFFENTELHELLAQEVSSLEDVYIKTIAEKFDFEKRQMVKELQQHGIHAILTAPQKLTVNTINKYLELKARGMI